MSSSVYVAGSMAEYLPFSRAVLRSVWIANVRDVATISARWFIFTER